MADFDQKQISVLRGSFKAIAESEGCSRRYVDMVVTGRRACNSKTSKNIVEKAKKILKVLMPVQ